MAIQFRDGTQIFDGRVVHTFIRRRPGKETIVAVVWDRGVPVPLTYFLYNQAPFVSMDADDETMEQWQLYLYKCNLVEQTYKKVYDAVRIAEGKKVTETGGLVGVVTADKGESLVVVFADGERKVKRIDCLATDIDNYIIGTVCCPFCHNYGPAAEVKLKIDTRWVLFQCIGCPSRQVLPSRTDLLGD